MNNNQEYPESITETKYLPDATLIEVTNYHQVNSMKIVLVGTGTPEVR